MFVNLYVFVKVGLVFPGLGQLRIAGALRAKRPLEARASSTEEDLLVLETQFEYPSESLPSEAWVVFLLSCSEVANQAAAFLRVAEFYFVLLASGAIMGGRNSAGLCKEEGLEALLFCAQGRPH